MFTISRWKNMNKGLRLETEIFYRNLYLMDELTKSGSEGGKNEL